MNILVVYSSRTGNTKRVAEIIATTMGVEAVDVKTNPNYTSYDLVVAGYWVDRGGPNAEMKDYLQGITHKQVALFATLGADPASEHGKKSLESGIAALGEGCTCVGTFICRGKVDPVLVEQMKGRFPEGHPHAYTPEWLARIDAAFPHPTIDDLEAAKSFAQELMTI